MNIEVHLDFRPLENWFCSWINQDISTNISIALNCKNRVESDNQKEKNYFAQIFWNESQFSWVMYVQSSTKVSNTQIYTVSQKCIGPRAKVLTKSMLLQTIFSLNKTHWLNIKKKSWMSTCPRLAVDDCTLYLWTKKLSVYLFNTKVCCFLISRRHSIISGTKS